MKKRNIYSILVLFFAIVIWLVDNYYVTESYESDEEVVQDNASLQLLLPTSTTNAVVNHTYFSLSYSEPFEQAEWVAYEIDKKYLTNDDRKRPYFIEDPFVKTKSADWKNYRGSGYDRGHLCAAGDMRFSRTAYDQTFYTSNISPQENTFNAGVWNRLEQKVRYWAKIYGKVFVVTGGILENGLDVIGEEDVAVPKYFYKIIAQGEGENLKILAFLMPHKESTLPLQNFVVPVDELEAMTGIDFFAKLPKIQEERLERGMQLNDWKF